MLECISIKDVTSIPSPNYVMLDEEVHRLDAYDKIEKDNHGEEELSIMTQGVLRGRDPHIAHIPHRQ